MGRSFIVTALILLVIAVMFATGAIVRQHRNIYLPLLAVALVILLVYSYTTHPDVWSNLRLTGACALGLAATLTLRASARKEQTA